MFKQTVKPLVYRTFATLWYPVDNYNMVLVVGWIEVALVANEDVIVEQRECEGFVLARFRTRFVGLSLSRSDRVIAGWDT